MAPHVNVPWSRFALRWSVLWKAVISTINIRWYPSHTIICILYIYIHYIYIFKLWIPSYNQLCTYRTIKEMPMHAYACILVDHVKLSKGGSKHPYLILKPTYCRWVIYNHMPWPIKRGEIWWNLSFYIIYVFCIIYIYILRYCIYIYIHYYHYYYYHIYIYIYYY